MALDLRRPIRRDVLKRYPIRLGEEELYQGPFVGEAPDLYLFFKEHFICFPRIDLGVKGVFTELPKNEPFSAHHLASLKALKGVLLMTGPAVRGEAEVREPRIVDLSPTILYLLGLPVPDYMDGRILEEVIIPEHLVTQPPLRVRYDGSPGPRQQLAFSQTEEEDIKAQLKGLGYLE